MNVVLPLLSLSVHSNGSVVFVSSIAGYSPMKVSNILQYVLIEVLLYKHG